MKNTALLRLIIYNIMPVYAMKAYQGVGVLLHALSTVTLGGRERSASQAALPERKSLLVAPAQSPEWAAPQFIYTS